MEMGDKLLGDGHQDQIAAGKSRSGRRKLIFRGDLHPNPVFKKFIHNFCAIFSML
jgi:hypothetical protein